MYIKQAVREQRIPFEITRNIPNKNTVEAINELDEMDKNPSKYKKYKNAEEIMGDILK